MSNLVRSTVAGIIAGTVADVGGRHSASQRIINGGFASGASWVIDNGAWAISAGRARTVEGAGGDALRQSFTAVPSGFTVALSVLVVSNTNTQTMQVYLTSGGSDVQLLLESAATGTLTAKATAVGSFDGIRFTVVEDAGVTTIDDVTLLA